MSLQSEIYIGTAGWNFPIGRDVSIRIEGQIETEPRQESHLRRYSKNLNCVEINSSFYKDHQPGTYRRWAQTVSDDFRFSVKLSRYFTQEKRLKESGQRLSLALETISHLGEKWGALLIQLPPSLRFDEKDARRFLFDLRSSYPGDVFIEPRHRSWSSVEAIEVLVESRVNKVLADPEPCPTLKDLRAKVEDKIYFRLHGTPEIYKSNYDDERLQKIASQCQRAKQSGRPVWCVFDNTTYGFATDNALQLKAKTRLGFEDFASPKPLGKSADKSWLGL